MVKNAVTGYKLAVLHQGAAAPAIGGVTKPFKPGGTLNPFTFISVGQC